jgi:hypothetical protein
MQMPKNINDLREAIASNLEVMIKRGLKPPIYSVMIGANGNMMAFHYVPHEVLGLDWRMVAEYIQEDEGIFRFPINLYFSDSSGRSEKAIIEAGE